MLPESQLDLLGRIRIAEVVETKAEIRDRVFAELTNIGTHNGWINACKSAVENGSEAWLSEYVKVDPTDLPWFLERLHNRERNPRNGSPADENSEPLVTRINIARSIADAALSALILGRLSQNTADESRIETLLSSIYRAVVRWQPLSSKAKLPLIPDADTFAEMRSCLLREGPKDPNFRAVLNLVQRRHPEWEVAAVAELISHFSGEQRDQWERLTAVNVPLVRWDKTGIVARLELEKRRNGVSAFYRDPFTAGFLQYDASFKRQLDSAWSYALAEFGVDGYEVRWRLNSLGQDLPNPVTGSSIGAGVAVALASLFTDDRIFAYGSKWAITGTVTDQGSIGTVNRLGGPLHDNYREKLEAVAGQHLKLIVPGEDWDQVKGDLSSGPINILKGASTVKEASDIIVSEERGEKRRLFFKRAFIASAVAAFILFIFASAAAKYAWKQKTVAVENGNKLADAKRELEVKNDQLTNANADLSNTVAQLDAAKKQLQQKNVILGTTNITLGQQKAIAESQRKVAEVARNSEQDQRMKAEEQRKIAEGARNEAQEQRKKAEQLEKVASAQRQLAVARQAELQADRAMAENDPASAQLLYAKALSLDERLDTKGRYLQSRTRQFMKPSWSSSIGYASSPIKLSPDGQVIAVGREDSSIVLLNATTGQPLKNLVNEDANLIASVAFSPDSQHLATASTNGIVTIWDYKSGEQIRVLRFRECKTNAAPSPEPSPTKKSGDDETDDSDCSGNVLMAFNSQGTQLAIGTINDPRISVWNVQNGTVTAALSYPGLYLTGLNFTGDGRIIASCLTGDIWVLQVGSNTAHQLKHNGRLLSASVSSSALLSTAGDNLIRIWNLTDNKQIFDHPLRHNLVNSVDFTSDGRFIISAASDGTIKLWEVSSGKEILGFDSGLKALDSIALTTNDRLVAKSNEGTYKLIKSWSLVPGASAIALGKPQGITADVVFSPDGTRIASLVAPDDSTFAAIDVWDASSRQLLNKIPLDKLMGVRGAVGNENGDSYLPPLSIQFAGNGRFIVLGGLGPKPPVFDAQTGSQIAPFTAGKDEPHIFTSIAASPDGVSFAAADDDGAIHIYDFATGLEQAVLKGHDEPVTYLKFSSDGRNLASSSLDKTVCVWDVRSKKAIKTFRSNPFPFLSVDLSRDGKMIAATSMDQKVHVWNLSSEKEVLNHEAFDPQVTSISFSPDGKWLAWCSFSTTDIHLLKVDSGEEVPSLHNARGPLMRVSFSPDGKWLAASGSESEINLWSMIEIERVYGSPAAVLLNTAESDTGLSIGANDGNSFADTKMPIFSRSELYSLAGLLTESTFPIVPLDKQRTQATENCRPVPIVATLNPFPVSFLNPAPACHNFPMLDARIVDGGHYSENDVIQSLGRTASNSDIIRVRIYVDNGAANNEPDEQAVARNVILTTSIDNNVGSEHWIKAFLAGDNTNSLSKTFAVRTPPDSVLEIVPNSGQIRDWQNSLLKDHVQIGANSLKLGKLSPGFETDLFLYFDVKVKPANKIPAITVLSERRRPSADDNSTVRSVGNKGHEKQCPNAPRVATLNPFPISFRDSGEPCTNFPPLDLGFAGKYSTNEGDWQVGRTAKAGDELSVLMYIDNGAANSLPLAQTLARNIQVRSTVDTSVGTEHLITVSFGGDNTNAVSHTITVRTAPNEFLEVVPNSGQLFDAYNHVIQSNLLVGNRITGLGDLAPGFETDLFLRFLVRVRSTGNDTGTQKSEGAAAASLSSIAPAEGLIAQCPKAPKFATFNPFPIGFANVWVPCTNVPALSLRLANRLWPKDEQEWNEEFKADDDDEIVVRVYLDNGSANNLLASQTIAKNVKVTTTVDNAVSAEHIATVTFSSDNAATFSKSLRIRTHPEGYLEVIPNSGELYNARGELLRKNFQVGNDVFEVGDLAAGFENDLTLLFKLRTKRSNTLTDVARNSAEGSRMTRTLSKGLSVNCPNPPASATLNPFPLTFASPPETCRNYSALDLKTNKLSQNEAELNAERHAKPGDEILAEIYIDNGAADNLPRAQTIARNVQVTIHVDESIGLKHSVSVSFAGENTNTVSKTLIISTQSSTRLLIVPNSGQLFDFQDSLLQNYIQLGNGTYAVGDVGPGFAKDLFLLFKIQVEGIASNSATETGQEQSRLSVSQKARGVNCPTPPSVATLNPYPITFASSAEYCKNYEPIDVRLATETGKYSQSEQDWKDGIDAQPTDELYALIYIDNGAANNLPLRLTNARNVRVTTQVEAGPGPVHLVSVSFSGENTNTVTATFPIHTPPDSVLEVVPNSGQIRNFLANQILKDHLQVGNNTINVGDIAPGFDTDLFIRFKLRVTKAIKKQNNDPEDARVTLSLNRGVLKNCPNAPAKATLNPFPLSFNDDQKDACGNYPPLDLRIVNGGKYSQNEDAWRRGLDAKPGDEIYALIYVDNGASDNGPLSQTTAKNVLVKSAVDTSVGSEHFVSVSFAGDKTNVVSKTLVIQTGSNDFLEVVPNSGEIFAHDTSRLQSNLEVGNNTFSLGNLNPGFQEDLFLRFKIRVRTANDKKGLTQHNHASTSLFGTPDRCPHAISTPILNPFPLTFSTPAQLCMNYPPLDLKFVNGGEYSHNQEEWMRGRTAKAGDELYALVYIDNGAANVGVSLKQTVAKEIKLTSFIDSTVGSEHFVSVFFGGQNTNVVAKSLPIRTPANSFLEVVPNSGELFGDQGNPPPLKVNFALGNNTYLVGDLGPGFETDLFLRFRIRVKTAPNK